MGIRCTVPALLSLVCLAPGSFVDAGDRQIHSFERIRLNITARDCGLAAEWTPSAQPFTLTWQDDHGDLHMDAGGDHDASMELELIRYFDVVCSNQPRADTGQHVVPARGGGDPQWRTTTTLSDEFIESATGRPASTPVRGGRVTFATTPNAADTGARSRPQRGRCGCLATRAGTPSQNEVRQVPQASRRQSNDKVPLVVVVRSRSHSDSSDDQAQRHSRPPRHAARSDCRVQRPPVFGRCSRRACRWCVREVRQENR